MLCPGCSWHSSRFSPDTGQGPLGHVYPRFKPLGAPAHWPLLQVLVEFVDSMLTGVTVVQESRHSAPVESYC